MQARTINLEFEIRMLDVKQLANYMGIGTSNARIVGEEMGALKRIGRRVLYDKKIVDKYLDELPAE